MNKFFSVVALSLLITSATNHAQGIPAATSTFMYNHPIATPALLFGGALLGAKVFDYTEKNMTPDRRQAIHSLKSEITSGYFDYPIISRILTLLGGAALFSKYPAMYETLVTKPLESNPYLTYALYGGVAAYVFAPKTLKNKLPAWLICYPCFLVLDQKPPKALPQKTK